MRKIIIREDTMEGDEDCCGVFNAIAGDNKVICNECGITINKAIELFSLKSGDTVSVASALKGAPDEFYKIKMGKNGTLILDDDMGTEINELDPEAIQKTYNDCSKCNGSGIDSKQTVLVGFKVKCTKCEGKK